MRAINDIEQRVKMLENAKAVFLCPAVFVKNDEMEGTQIDYLPGAINYLRPGVDAATIAPQATLESLNGELAALRWVLDEWEPTQP